MQSSPLAVKEFTLPHHVPRGQRLSLVPIQALCSSAPSGGPEKVKGSLRILRSSITQHQSKPRSLCKQAPREWVFAIVTHLLVLLYFTLLTKPLFRIYQNLCQASFQTPDKHQHVYIPPATLRERPRSQAMWWMWACPPHPALPHVACVYLVLAVYPSCPPHRKCAPPVQGLGPSPAAHLGQG